jgi:hypothetical protein
MEELNHYIFSYTNEYSDILITDANRDTIEAVIKKFKTDADYLGSKIDYVHDYLKNAGYTANCINTVSTIYDI